MITPPRAYRGLVVRVPATSGNLGPGFDVLGLALSLYNWVGVEKDDSLKTDQVLVHGEGDEILRRDGRNLIVKAFRLFADERKATLPPVRITCWNNIPLSRGLGSSAAAVVGGLVAAHALLARRRTRQADLQEILLLATRLEGHPDNAAAALLGGLTLATTVGGGPRAIRLPVEQFPGLLLVIPPDPVVTRDARRVLPKTVPLEDAVFNLGRQAFLLAALTGRAPLAPWMAEDRLHQPYRWTLIPGARKTLESAIEAGALGGCVSGAGSSLLLFLPSNRAGRRHVLATVRHAMPRARLAILSPNTEGARIMRTLKEEAPSG